jgi:hypothetical protein
MCSRYGYVMFGSRYPSLFSVSSGYCNNVAIFRETQNITTYFQISSDNFHICLFPSATSVWNKILHSLSHTKVFVSCIRRKLKAVHSSLLSTWIANFKLIIHYNSLCTEALTEQPEGQSQSQQQYTRNNKQTNIHTYIHTNEKEHKNNKPKVKNSMNLTKIPDLFYNIVNMHIHNN